MGEWRWSDLPLLYPWGANTKIQCMYICHRLKRLGAWQMEWLGVLWKNRMGEALRCVVSTVTLVGFRFVRSDGNRILFLDRTLIQWCEL